MKNLKFLSVLAVLTVFGVHSLAQSDNGSGTASAVIVPQTVTLTNVQNIDFGSILPASQPGTVRISTNSNNPDASTTATPTNNITVNGTPTVGKWDIQGVANALVTITLPSDNQVQLSNGVQSMSVTSFNPRSIYGTAWDIRLDGNGQRRFAVEATLNLVANQPPGSYSANYDVSVSYQ